MLLALPTQEANWLSLSRVIQKSDFDDIGTEKELMTSEHWNLTIDECHKTYFLPQDCSKALQASNTKLWNTLLLVHDFSMVVEAKRAKKAGDVGQLMLIWKKWCLICQALPWITNYSSYLPRTSLLITVILLPSLRNYLQRNLLISPSGRKDHFVAKEFWLEVQNYWLKFLYNKSGSGTHVENLKDAFCITFSWWVLNMHLHLLTPKPKR